MRKISPLNRALRTALGLAFAMLILGLEAASAAVGVTRPKVRPATIGVERPMTRPAAATVDDPAWSFWFRSASVFKENPFTPLESKLLLVAPPGNDLAYDFVSIFSATPMAHSRPGTEFTFQPFSSDSYYFAQVNTYYHGHRFVDYLNSLGFDYTAHPISYLLNNPPTGGAFVGNNTSGVTLGGVGGRADGEDADVIVHETTHAAFNFLVPGVTWEVSGPNNVPATAGQWKAIAEGLADYFASVMNGNYRIAEYNAAPTGGWWSIETNPGVYNYNNPAVMGGSFYSAGQVFSGALVDLRKQIGSDADLLVFNATTFLTDGFFKAYYDAIRAADIGFFSGAHLAAIQSVFAARGIPASSPWTGVTGPDSVEPLAVVALSATTRCGVAPFSHAWFERPVGGTTWTDTGLRGASVSYVAGNQSVDIRVDVTDALGGHSLSEEKRLTVTAPGSVAAQPMALDIVGSSRGTAGVPGEFRVLAPNAVGGVTLTWELETNGARVPLGSGSSVLVDPEGGRSTVLVRAVDAVGRVAVAELQLDGMSAPVVQIEGPESLGPEESKPFVARVEVGRGPGIVRWTQVAGDRILDLGSGIVVRNVPSSDPFVLIAEVTDSDGQVAGARLAVGTTPVLATDQEGRTPFTAIPSIIRRGEMLRFSVEPMTGPFELQAVDVTGRKLWHYGGRGEGVSFHVNCSTAALPPGVVFVSFTAPGAVKRVARVVVLQ